MVKPATRITFLLALLLTSFAFIHAQAKPLRSDETKSTVKPFKILTNGRQITIQAKQNIKSVMAWTAGGHRFIEEKDLKTTSYTFIFPTKEKICFLMIETAEGKRFTEKIGVQ
jgi:hypothetical protein